MNKYNIILLCIFLISGVKMKPVHHHALFSAGRVVFACLFLFLLSAGMCFSEGTDAEPDDFEISLPPEVEFFSPELSDNTDLILEPFFPGGGGESDEYPEGEETPLPPLASMQEFWESKNLSLSTRETFYDGTAFQPLESSVLPKLFYELSEAPPQYLWAWARPGEELADFETLSRPQRTAARFELYHVTGTLKSIREVPLPKELFYTLRQMRKYWIVQMELADGRTVEMYSLRVPRAFQPRKGVLPPGMQDMRVGAYAVLMKLGRGEPPLIYMLTHRLEYYPDNFLGNRGMDYGLFDDLDRQPLNPQEMRSRTADIRLGVHNRECFYRLLYCVSNIPRKDLKQHSVEVLLESPADRLTPDGKYSHPLPLFQRPVDERGNYFLIRGTAKEVLSIRVEEEDIIERFGITGYYQMAIFTAETGDNPLFIMVTELPEGMKPGHDSDYSVDVTVPAFFFNTWGYSSRNEEGKRVKRLTPLLMGGKPIFTPRQEPIRARWIEMLLAIFVAGGILGLGFLLLYSERKEQALRKKLLRSRGLPEGEVLDETKFDRTGYPDFTRWGEDAADDKKP